MPLRRSDLTTGGFTRRRSGAGFRYVDASGRALPAADARRCRGLAIPPAWRRVWISPDEWGHIQATGVDSKGRCQYLYHPQWRRRRDRRKFRHVRDVAAALPRLRRRVGRDLAGRGTGRDRVLALAARLLDLGLFRIGGDAYATGTDATFGVATLRADHVTRRGDTLDFRYRAKGGIERRISITDPAVLRAVAALRRHRRGGDRLLAWRQDRGGGWREVRAGDVNAYLREASGGEMTAKDLRTWHATVQAAARLARADPPASPTAARRTVARVIREVAGELGNTPAVARASYVDPEVIDRFEDGETIAVPPRAAGPAVEAAVRELLRP